MNFFPGDICIINSNARNMNNRGNKVIVLPVDPKHIAEVNRDGNYNNIDELVVISPPVLCDMLQREIVAIKKIKLTKVFGRY